METKRILVVDDCKLTLSMMEDLLCQAGFQVIATQSVMDANRHINTPPYPDLALIDVEMPFLKGHDMVKILRTGTFPVRFPLLLMSDKPSEELESLCRTSGANGYLKKPFSGELVLKRVAALLN